MRYKTNPRGVPSGQPVNLRIGVTGHRRHRLKVSDDRVMQRILEVIELLRRAGRLESAGQIEVVSALAEGADEIAARAALIAGCRLMALLPFKPKDYETMFSEKSYRPVFRDLVRKSDNCIVLPGSLKDANAAYVAVGEETLVHSDIVLTIWDGAPAHGRGGSPDILQSALERRLRIIWLHATQDSPPRLIERSTFGPCPHLENAARRATRVSLRYISEQRLFHRND